MVGSIPVVDGVVLVVDDAENAANLMVDLFDPGEAEDGYIVGVVVVDDVHIEDRLSMYVGPVLAINLVLVDGINIMSASGVVLFTNEDIRGTDFGDVEIEAGLIVSAMQSYSKQKNVNGNFKRQIKTADHLQPPQYSGLSVTMSMLFRHYMYM